MAWVKGWGGGGGRGLVWGVAFVETRCAGSLGGSGRVGWGIWDGGWSHFGRQDCPPPPPPVLRSLDFPSFFLCFCPLQLCFQSPASNPRQGVEGEERSLPLPPLPAAVSSGSFTFLLLVSLPPHPRFSFCLLLPQFLSLMMWLTPSPTPTCRRLARWAGASRSCK